MVIVMDFKENIRLPLSSRQTSRMFYHQQQVSCLGFVCYFEGEKGKIIQKNINFTSECLNHDSVYVIDCLDYLLRKMKDYRQITIWTDCGPHFRNKHLLSFLLHDLPQRNFHVDVNYFGESHGKNQCDIHFSVISRQLQEISQVKDINNVSELMLAMNDLNTRKESQAKLTDTDHIHRIFVGYHPNKYPLFKKEMNFVGVKHDLCFVSHPDGFAVKQHRKETKESVFNIKTKCETERKKKTENQQGLCHEINVHTR